MKPFLTIVLWFLTANVTAELPHWAALADRARWAANAHNVQSWRLVSVPVRGDQKRLVLHPDRLLPETDPEARQLVISLGAFLAVLEDEAGSRGASVAWVPLDDQPGVLVTLSEEGSEKSHLPEGTVTVDALTAPTVKYRTTALSFGAAVRSAHEASSAIVGLRWLADPGEVAAAKLWAQGAFDLEMDLARTRDESIRVTRYGEDARRLRPWGITLLPNFSRDHLFWVESLAVLFPQSPEDYAQSAKNLMKGALEPIEQILVLKTAGNGVREQIETGRVLQRVWLDVRARGGELLPLSQGLQEFPEMADFYREAHRRWATEGETVQMVLALFRPASGVFLPSPRIPAAEILVP